MPQSQTWFVTSVLDSFPDANRDLQEFPDEDWWSGEFNGKQGLFPAAYVRLNE